MQEFGAINLASNASRGTGRPTIQYCSMYCRIRRSPGDLAAPTLTVPFTFFQRFITYFLPMWPSSFNNNPRGKLVTLTGLRGSLDISGNSNTASSGSALRNLTTQISRIGTVNGSAPVTPERKKKYHLTHLLRKERRSFLHTL